MEDFLLKDLINLLKQKEQNTEFDLGEYENEINQPKTQISPSSTDNEKIYSQLKKLKELLDLDILTKEEFDKKANELKKLILD